MKYLSVMDKDEDILKSFSQIFLKGEWFDLDCTYSKGVFYKNTLKPLLKSDLYPTDETIMKIDCREIGNKFVRLNSVVFDPPFLFRNRLSENNDKISKRFSCFESYEKLQDMYKSSLESIYDALDWNGYLFMKCQDMTDGKFYCTHNFVINEAERIGFVLKDIGIKATKTKLQRDAKQQNCLAKVHSYWLVLKKVRNK